MKDPEGIGSRLKEVRKYLRRTLADFYGPITSHYNNLSPVENGTRSIGSRLLKEIAGHYCLSEDWLLTGHGEMFLPDADPFGPVPKQKQGVPYFNVDVIARREAFSVVNDQPEYLVDYQPFNDCTAYIPVYGDSMYPRFAGGDIIALKEVTNLEVIQWGEAYLVVADQRSNDLRSIKLLFQHDDPEKIILRSSNPNYKGDTVISKSSIVSLFIIKGKITRSLI
jgi:phage repressor protein C with HTH and peptisase S24 domain